MSGGVVNVPIVFRLDLVCYIRCYYILVTTYYMKYIAFHKIYFIFTLEDQTVVQEALQLNTHNVSPPGMLTALDSKFYRLMILKTVNRCLRYLIICEYFRNRKL